MRQACGRHACDMPLTASASVRRPTLTALRSSAQRIPGVVVRRRYVPGLSCCCLVHDPCCLVHVACCVLPGACCLSHAVWCMLHVACCSSAHRPLLQASSVGLARRHFRPRSCTRPSSTPLCSATHTMQRAMYNMQYTPYDMQHATCDIQHTHASWVLQHAARWVLQHAA